MNTFTELNLVATGGQFGHRRRLSTMTIHFHAKSGTYFVRDDVQNGALKGAGFPTVESAEDAFKSLDETRTRLY